MDVRGRTKDIDENSRGRGMIVQRIEAHNFMQYPELILDNIPEKGVIGIFGRNEFGKSTIADAISFALFGEIPRSKAQAFKKSDFVRWEAKSCQVSMIFEIEGRKFEVWRKLTASGQGDAHIRDLGTDEVLAVKIKAVNDCIENKILGYGFDEYRHSSYVAQKEIELITQNTGEVKDVINNMLGISLLAEAGTECHRERKKVNDDVLPGVKNTLDVLNDRMEKWSGKRNEANEVKEEIGEISERIRELDELIKDKKKEHKELEEVKKIETEREKLKTLLDEKKKQIKPLKEQVEESKKAGRDYDLLMEQLQDEELKKHIENSELVNKTIEMISEQKGISEKSAGNQKEIKQLEKQQEAMIEKQNTLKRLVKLQKESEPTEREYMVLTQLNSFKDDLFKIRDRLMKARKDDMTNYNTKKKQLSDRMARLKGIDKSEEDEINQKITNSEEEVNAFGSKLEDAKSKYKIPIIAALIPIILGLLLAVVINPLLGVGVVIVGVCLGALFYVSVQKIVKNASNEFESAKCKYDTLREEKGRLQALRTTREQMVADIKELNQTVQQLERKLQNTLKGIKVVTEIEKHKVVEVIQLCKDSQHTELIEAITFVSDLPTDILPDTTLQSAIEQIPEMEEVVKASQEREPLIKQFQKEIKQIEPLKKEIDEKRQELDKIREEIKEMKENITENLELLAIQDDESTLEHLNALREKIDNVKQVAKKTEGSLEELEKRKVKFPELTKKLDEAEKDIKKVEKVIGELPKEVELNEEYLEELEEELEKLDKEELELKKNYAGMESRIKELIGDDKVYKKLSKDIEEKNKEIVSLSALVDNYTDLRGEFTELPKTIREGISPQLQQYFSWVLPRITDDRYQMVEVSGEFKMRIFSEDKGDFVDISQLSGGTKDQLSMSLRLGFSRALNAAKSQDKQFIFLDEPFSSFDKGRREAFIEFLRNFEKTFQQIFLISHIEGLENLVDEFIRIEKDSEGYSQAIPSWHD